MEDLKEDSKLQLNHIGMKASTMIHGLLKEKQRKLFLVVVISPHNKLSFAVIVITVVHQHSFFMLLLCKHVFLDLPCIS